MRVKHDRKAIKLNHLVEKGAEPQKIESLRSEVRGLSTKIRIAIQIVDRISVKMNKLRDEELWPQLNELIQGYVISLIIFLLVPIVSIILVVQLRCPLKE